MHGSAVGVQGLEAMTLRRSEIQGLCRVFRRRPCMHGSAVGVQGLIAETLRRSEQPMRSTWAQVQGPEAETLQEFKGAIVTINDRASGMLLMRKVPRKESALVARAAI
jgi:hypothetical protein